MPPFSLSQEYRLRGHEGAVLAVRFNSDGRYCLTCGRDRSLRLWNPFRGLQIKSYSGHSRDVRDVAVTSDNARLVSCGGDRNLFMWDVASGRILRRFRGHDSEVNAVALNEFDSVAASAAYDAKVRLFDLRSHSPDAIQVLDVFSDSVTSVLLTSFEIIAASVDGSIRTFDIRRGRVLCDSFGSHLAVNSIAISRDSNCLLAAINNSTLQLIDRASSELLNSYSGHLNLRYKLDCAFSNDDAHVISGSEDGHLFVWDLVDANVVAKEKAHDSVVTSVAVHPSEPYLMTSSTDGSSCLWKTSQS